MDQKLKANKQILRQFMRQNYTTERLCQLLAHARDGKLAYLSCCCFIGAVTADHPLRGEIGSVADMVEHLHRARQLPGAIEAENAFVGLGVRDYYQGEYGDAIRCRRVIPMILVELRRRERLHSALEAIHAEVLAEQA